MNILIAGAALFVAGGWFFDKAGEGINDASNGALKLIAVGGVAYIVYKKVL